MPFLAISVYFVCMFPTYSGNLVCTDFYPDNPPRVCVNYELTMTRDQMYTNAEVLTIFFIVSLVIIVSFKFLFDVFKK